MIYVQNSVIVTGKNAYRTASSSFEFSFFARKLIFAQKMYRIIDNNPQGPPGRSGWCYVRLAGKDAAYAKYHDDWNQNRNQD